MSRAVPPLIKKHLAAVVGSRPVVVEAEPDGWTPPEEEPAVPAAAEEHGTPDADAPAPTQVAPADAGEPAAGDCLPEESGAVSQQLAAVYEEARRRGERDGWEAGFAAGQEAGWARARQEAEDTVHAALALLEDARRERALILRQARQDVVRLALDLAARILEREVSASPEVVREQAALLLRRLEQGEKAVLHLHPDDVAVLEPWLPELARACGANLEVVPDAAVGRGGVMVETEHGYLDGRLDRQLRRLGEALLAWTASLPGPAVGGEGHEAARGGEGGDGQDRQLG